MAVAVYIVVSLTVSLLVVVSVTGAVLVLVVHVFSSVASLRKYLFAQSAPLSLASLNCAAI